MYRKFLFCKMTVVFYLLVSHLSPVVSGGHLQVTPSVELLQEPPLMHQSGSHRKYSRTVESWLETSTCTGIAVSVYWWRCACVGGDGV